MGLKNYLFGFNAENIATKFLQKNGFEIIERNFHSRFGEIDIIAKKDEILHFIEVKATSKNYETAYRITPTKLSKIIKTLNFYFTQHKINLNYQIDAILINNQDCQLIENITQ